MSSLVARARGNLIKKIVSNSHTNLHVKKALILVTAMLLTSCGINNIPTFDESVDAAWSEVQNQYKRRADLVPNLIETVKGFAAQEKEVFIEVTEARAKVSQMNVSPEMLSDPAAFEQFQQNQAGLGGALSKLMLVAERYPDLKSNENFLQLQNQLEGTENRIAVARGDYIKAVQRYNTELRTIPGRWWKKFMYAESTAKETFSAEEADTVNPSVNFNDN